MARTPITQQVSPWYRDAVIYGIDIAKFSDGNGDGIGDFVGLTEKLPYLEELGATCLWLLPFFATPNKDNGYDVSNYYEVNPDVGTREDFLDFLHAAGEHGIRVIVDLVANHTSNEHPWFEAARRDERSPFRDYYVWSERPPPLTPGQRSIFPGEVDTVWTYDEIARAYYFHNFYPFQPELNTANRQVREEMLRVMDYWVSLGVMGFRIDAAPLLVGDNGLQRADPDDPHGVLREMSNMMHRRRPEALLLGEVNMPIKEVGTYFGSGDQLNLLFNFFGACYMFAAFAMEDAGPIHQAFSQMPQPPDGCGWANFLRNLDELDFSRVPVELKQAAFKTFAPEENMQVFGRGIRWRLAPMLGGDKDRVSMALSLLLSFPGTPVLVYGNEIGMGDDLEKPGRNAVRSPMQWTGADNAGFSKLPAIKMVQVPIDKGPFAASRVNVRDQQADPDSLLSRVKAMIALRRKHGVGSARLQPLPADEKPIFAHAAIGEAGTLLAVHNLSGKAVRAEVTLRDIKEKLWTDLGSGKSETAESGKLKLSLPAYGYRWLAAGEG